VAVDALAGYRYVDKQAHPSGDAPLGPATNQTQVQGSGIVTRILADDTHGSRHQRFVLRLPSGQTVLVAYNIDVAPRVGGLKLGDVVEYSGQYVWNAMGGVVHWTHRDPSGRRVAGWLRHDGRTFQ
jgi:hypothetical protein